MMIERKNKNILFLVSIFALLYLFYSNDFGIISTVGNLQISEAEYHELIEERTESELENTFRLKVDDYVLPYDEVTDSFLFSVANIENLDEYNPRFKIVMNENLNYNIALLDYNLTEETVMNNEPVRLIVYTEDMYDEFDIYLTKLPILTLNMEQSLEKTRPIGAEYQKASMVLYDSTELIESDLYIRMRGASSRAFPKNQYRVNLREFTIGGDEKLNHLSLLGMREDDDWILYSPYNDPEKARNTLSNSLWHDTMGEENRFGINTGVEGEYIEVFINNRYWGLYVLMYPNDAKQVDLDIENKAENSEIYYRSVSNIRLKDTDFENSTGNEQMLGRFELREPNEPFGEPEQWAPLHEHMMMLYTDVETLEEYLFERTDIHNQINYYLFTLLLQATDNNLKNHNYISKFDGETRIMLESPWDLDLTWGLRWHPESHLLAQVKDDPALNHLPFATLVYEGIEKGSKKVSKMVKDKYKSLRANEWSEEAFMARLDTFEKDIYHSGAIQRDKERWPDTAYNENMDELRNYILQRLKAMDKYIENEI